MTSNDQQSGLGPPTVVSDTRVLRELLRVHRAEGRTIGLVPTMGALHDGHLSLVKQSVAQTDVTVVTIFVNPTQFSPSEDLDQYPRTLDADLELLATEGADLVFFPSIDQIYPHDFSTHVAPPDVGGPLEGRCRPGHFRGVATIVLKLFNIAPADVAFFGQKDFQQVRVVQQMVRDLSVPIRIEVCPIVREPDGLAMSSRNRYLTGDERGRATALIHCLERASDLVRQGHHDSTELLAEMRSVLQAAGIERIDYVALVDPETMTDVERVTDDTMALVAAYIGETRLIDNCQIG